MRVLLIAYEFPPSPSPQSLRWIYLCRELAILGHEIHVLTIDLGGTTPGLPELPPEVTVHRTFAGPVRGMLATARSRRHRATSKLPSPAQAEGEPIRPARSWKQSISEALQSAASAILFPDMRGEWHRWGKQALSRLLKENEFDVVISSHEPATTLELGKLATQANLPWVADLGDPVLAPYTPKRWKNRSWALEHSVCLDASHVITTNLAAAQLMQQRHGRKDRITVLTQGFDDRNTDRQRMSGIFDPTRIELFYSGSFYSFRNPGNLMRALAVDSRIRLSIAAITVPEPVLAAARLMPEQIRLLGFMPHLDVIAMQKHADLLINIANEDPSQIPGKVFEYLGAERPILHLRSQHHDDAIGSLITRLGRGWSCQNNEHDISDWLRRICLAGEVELPTDSADISAYAWRNIAKELEAILLGAKGRS